MKTVVERELVYEDQGDDILPDDGADYSGTGDKDGGKRPDLRDGEVI